MLVSQTILVFPSRSFHLFFPPPDHLFIGFTLTESIPAHITASLSLACNFFFSPLRTLSRTSLNPCNVQRSRQARTQPIHASYYNIAERKTFFTFLKSREMIKNVLRIYIYIKYAVRVFRRWRFLTFTSTLQTIYIVIACPVAYVNDRHFQKIHQSDYCSGNFVFFF